MPPLKPSQKSILEGIKEENHKLRAADPHKKTGDADLLTSMAARLAIVEKELLAAKREIIEKDNQIRKLEEKILMLKISSTSQEVLQSQCQALQEQIDEMEEFLGDYGLIWVGKTASHKELTIDPVISTELIVDFDKIISNIQMLNQMAGEDCPQVKRTPTGAELKVPEPVPITLYSNGLFMFDGPFRPYTDPSTKQVIQDLSDGYFPSELQHKYPDGIPFKLNDKRLETYQPSGPLYSDTFPGEGKALSNQATPNPHSRSISIDKFLSRIPKNIIKNGQVINIHEELTQTLTGNNTRIPDTSDRINKIKKRLDFDEKDCPPPSRSSVTRLRIKSETGDATYVLKMKCTDTIGDLYRHVNTLKPNGGKYVIKGAFPPRSFTEMNTTLTDSGLCPNANLFLAKIL
jgi:hypothetical protein